MKNMKQIFEKILKYFNYSIKTILLKHSKKTNNILKYKFFGRISNFNKYLIVLISLLFIYLFYLTIPTLYEKNWVQNTIEKKLLNEFKVNFSLSSEISYRILPAPNFSIDNVKILNENIDNPKVLSEIKNLKIFISQGNLFNKQKIEIKSVLINNANFSIQSKDFSFFQKLFNQKFSSKKIKIKSSNVFLKDSTNETLLINRIKKINLYNDKKNSLNIINLDGEIFNTPFTLKFTKDLENKNNITLVKSQKLKLKYNNNSTSKKKITNGLSKISILNSKLNTKYELRKKKLSFKSSNSKLFNSGLEYEGLLNLDPFDLNLIVDLEKINLKKIFDSDSFFFDLLRSKELFNSNLSVNINLNSPNILDHRILKDLKLIFNIKDEIIDFDKSSFLVDKIGKLTLENSSLTYSDTQLVFFGDFNLNIKNHIKFFNFIQTPKKDRKPIKNINFSLDFNFQENQFALKNININNVNSNLKKDNNLDNFTLKKDNQGINSIEFKNIVNEIINSYDG